MNSKELEIKECSLQHSGATVVPTQVNLNKDDETCTLVFEDVIPVGPAVLSMSFKGIHNDEMCGFYRTKVTNKDGVEYYNLITQFEATDARRCLPCWDEPALKATFDATLIVPKDLVALSNMNVISEEVLEDQVSKKVVFAKSKKMSTYLLAFVVGAFDYVQGKTNDGVEVKVYTPPGKSSQGKYPLEVTIKSVEYFTEFFSCPYPMNKLDLIAITDFSCSAMENWGLITYRESALLVDEKESSVAQKCWVTIVVCHEVSHQWFGNLVTMEWWTHLWLNEGFATFMMYDAGHICDHDLKVWEQYVNDVTIKALDADSLENSHAIEIPVKHPSEIGEIFDAISYQKGSNIIGMIHSWIGADKFKEGMKAYFKKHAYSNTQTEDLWKCFEDASSKPVEQVMSTWTKQMGYPVIDVSIASQNDNSVTLNLSQKKFCISSSDESDSLWQVPISISTSTSEEHQSFIFSSKSDQITVEGVGANDWFKINPGFIGFYRVNYSQDILSKLISVIENGQLNCFDRLNIVSDVHAMATTGQTSFATYLELLKVFKGEKEYPVWKEIIKSLSAMTKLMWNDDEASKKFSQFKKDLFSSVMAHIGMEAKQGESHLDASLRALLITASNDDKVNQKCKEIMNDFFKNSTPISPEIRASVYKVYTSKGGLEAFNKMVELHKKVDSMEEKTEIEAALGCVQGLECLKLVQEYMMSSHVRDNEKYKILIGMATESKLGRDESWKFVKEHWDVFYQKFKGGHLLGKIVEASTPNFATEEMLNEVKEFLTEKISKSWCERKFKQCVEQIGLKIQLWQQNGQSLKDYFN